MNVHEAASQLHNEMLRIFSEEYKKLAHAKTKTMDPKYDPNNKTFGTYDYTNGQKRRGWKKNQEEKF